eukprot:scaffold128064_cov32-Prasinocladus_malaysianus.AAC.1
MSLDVPICPGCLPWLPLSGIVGCLLRFCGDSSRFLGRPSTVQQFCADGVGGFVAVDHWVSLVDRGRPRVHQ